MIQHPLPLHPVASRIEIVPGIPDAVGEVARAAAASTRFLDDGWFRAAVGPRASRTIVARAPCGRPLIALPLVRGRGWLHAVPGPYWPFRSFPIAEGLAADALVPLLTDRAARRTLGPAWRIGPVPADDPALAALRIAAPLAGWQIATRTIATTHVLDMAALAAGGGWPRNSTLRKNRFHEKHLAAHGALEWRHVSGSDWTVDILDRLAAVEARSWHGGSRDAKFLGPAHRAHWQALIADPAGAARMKAGILSVGGEPAAFAFDLDVGDTRYAIANSYDPAFARHSPGKCLSYRSLALGLAQGIARVDWGAGDSGYKATFGAVPGAELLDCLILSRALPRAARALAARLWMRSGRAAEVPGSGAGKSVANLL